MTERAAVPRPLPKVDRYTSTKPFWEGAKDHRLLIQYCKDTGKPQWFPRSVSVFTGHRDLEWREVSGLGTIYTFTVTHSAWPGHESRVPYVVALVELDEGVRMLAGIVNCEAADVLIGMPVRVSWEHLSDDFEYPAFEPV
jgi:uncharacterized OB-fold protein